MGYHHMASLLTLGMIVAVRACIVRGEEHIDSIISSYNSCTNGKNETMEDRKTLENPESKRPSP